MLTDGSAEGYLIDKIETDYSYQANNLVISDCDIVALSTEPSLMAEWMQKNLDFKVDIRDIDLKVLYRLMTILLI